MQYKIKNESGQDLELNGQIWLAGSFQEGSKEQALYYLSLGYGVEGLEALVEVVVEAEVSKPKKHIKLNKKPTKEFTEGKE